jgi:hypothetical protein
MYPLSSPFAAPSIARVAEARRRADTVRNAALHIPSWVPLSTADANVAGIRGALPSNGAVPDVLELDRNRFLFRRMYRAAWTLQQHIGIMHGVAEDLINALPDVVRAPAQPDGEFSITVTDPAFEEHWLRRWDRLDEAAQPPPFNMTEPEYTDGYILRNSPRLHPGDASEYSAAEDHDELEDDGPDEEMDMEKEVSGEVDAGDDADGESEV